MRPNKLASVRERERARERERERERESEREREMRFLMILTNRDSECNQVFLQPLTKSAIISPTEINNLFSNVEIVANLNRTLADEFEASEKDASEKGGVLLLGETFLKLADYLKMYTTYCANQPVSLATLEACSEQPAFAQFLSVCPNDTTRHRFECERA
jgi:hypothetical protein